MKRKTRNLLLTGGALAGGYALLRASGRLPAMGALDPSGGLGVSERYNIANAHYELLKSRVAVMPESAKAPLNVELGVARSNLIDAFSATSLEKYEDASAALSLAEQKLNTVQAAVDSAMTPTGAVVAPGATISPSGVVVDASGAKVSAIPAKPLDFLAKIPSWAYLLAAGGLGLLVFGPALRRRLMPAASRPGAGSGQYVFTNPRRRVRR